jgi:hypothetical protein
MCSRNDDPSTYEPHEPICRVRGCIGNALWHARRYARLELTVGRQAADAFDERHQPIELDEEDICMACPQVRLWHTDNSCPNGQFKEAGQYMEEAID